jgi:trk system potassium uptake protein TrkH
MSRLRRSTEVSYAVRFGVVFKYVGQLCLLAAILACVPGAFAIACGELPLSLGYFGVATVLAAIGATGWQIKAPRCIQRNEAFVIAGLIFPISATVMTIPGMMMVLAFEDAFFESVSGVTTTGLSTLPTVEERPRTFLFAREWQQ